MGTCNEMCPEGWYQEAVANNQVTEFEKIDPLGQGRSPRELAVKAFKRSVSPYLCTIAVCTLWCTARFHCVSGGAPRGWLARPSSAGRASALSLHALPPPDHHQAPGS